jgi:hypothetical protein
MLSKAEDESKKQANIDNNGDTNSAIAAASMELAKKSTFRTSSIAN